MKYVVLPPDVIGEIMDGQRTTLPVTFPAEVGSTIGLKTGPNRRATCLMDIVACDPDPGGYTIRLRPHVYEDTPRLLHSRYRRPPTWAADEPGQYTHMSAFAMIGSMDPGEAIDPVTQERLTREARERDDRRRGRRQRAAKRDRGLLDIEERVIRARSAASSNRISIHAELRAIRHMQQRGRPEGLVISELERVERLAYREAA